MNSSGKGTPNAQADEPISFVQAIDIARSGKDLSASQTGRLIDTMLRGEADEDQIGQLLLQLREKGEAVSEIVGAAQAMRQHMTRIPHSHQVLLDTCGTGGSESGSFNISTGIAIVTAACGVPVAKHGNRKATSVTGSADVLEELGVPIESDADKVAERLDQIGLCFCFAVKLHPAMKHVVGIRRKLRVKTLFNLLGPLCNPAGATHQLLGTSRPEAQTKISQAIAQLSTTRSFVVHAADGQDEVSLDRYTDAVEVRGDEIIGKHRWTPEDFGLLPAGVESLHASGPAESAQIIRQILDGAPGPKRDTVVAGTAAALLLTEKVATLAEGVSLAQQTIDNGAAREKLQQLANS
ncbi:anthranilate phosphoribosyltransferase [Rhodopirellula sp. MGV]|uniref:anthranilate phosphoribosyltransferase n=1 Tax=Rhodopirellula sp. MGV TaxID=2023130 RepID=UPI000B967445|nr:anthranilate phosphoribosyltransferase [Rhodopirellula sp. MGV]OYP34439.1 anthranilate phosphoribosyltransferase [Rhodopirellula sp. MGV]PNY37385.1 anthranilate phosphoribosyltransferase [Rhodopirellula baltica]